MMIIAISKEGHRIIEHIRQLFSMTNQQFNGTVSLGRYLTHYDNYIVSSNIACTIGEKRIGGSAEIRMIGDGTHTPTFTEFVKSSGSSDYDSTLNAINKIVFYYDGEDVFYSISVL